MTKKEKEQENISGQNLDNDSSLEEENTLFIKINDLEENFLNEEREKRDYIDKDLQKKNVEYKVPDKKTKEGSREQGHKINQSNDDALEKTLFSRKDDDRNIDKTVIRPLSKEEKKDLERLRKKNKEEIEGKKKQSLEKIKPLVPSIKNDISFDEETVVFSIKKEKKNIIQEIKESEREIIIRKNESNKMHVRESGPREKEIDNLEEVKDNSNKKKLILFISVFIILFLFLFNGEDFFGDEKKFKPVFPEIIFPVKLKFKEIGKSKDLEQEGNEYYQKGGYFNIVKASQLYRSSLGYNFDNNFVLGKLILAYSELLKDSKNLYMSSATLMKLIRIANRRAPNDINYTTGAAIFFSYFDRDLSSINIIERFLKIGKKPTVKLIRYYLRSLLRVGMTGQAEGVFSRLNDIKKKDIDSYIGLLEYYIGQGKFKKANILLKEAFDQYPENIKILLLYCKALQYSGKFQKQKEILIKFKSVGFNQSPYYYSQYLKYMGINSLINKDSVLAIKLFKESLKFVEDIELRKNVESLENIDKNDDVVKSFLNENKIITLIEKSEKSLRQENFKTAIGAAIKAVDLNNDYYPAIKQLAKVQRILGQFQNSINLLKKYIANNSTSMEARLDLLEAYIHSFRFQESEKIISEIKKISEKHSRRYSFLLGKYYWFRRSDLFALAAFKDALEKDPLNDEILYYLAKIYIANGKFNGARGVVVQAIELNPGVVKYRSLYGYILYELDGVGVALGYVRKTLDEFKDHPLLMGDIAKYYYKSGQQKEFANQLEKIKSFPSQSKDLYKSLFENSLLNGDGEEMLKYGKELMNWAPGDLQANFEFAERLLEIKKYKESLDIIENISERLPTFPKLYYLKGLIYSARNNINGAIEQAMIEIKNNPHLVEPYLLLGQLYLVKKDLQQARKYYSDAYLKSSNHPDVLYGLGYTLFLLRRYEESLSFLQKLEQLDSGNFKAKLLLGYVFEKMDQRGLAVEYFKKYLELNPDANDKNKIKSKILKMR